MTSQVNKDYAGDPVKSKSRKLVRDSVSRNLHFRDPKDIKVLCFPGVNATEVTEVYDSLGIPRENIRGIERDKGVYEMLARQDLGLNLGSGPTTLEDFVEGTEHLDFDVVSLDYTGPVTQDQLDVLREILIHNKKNHLVLHTANLLKRDHKSRGLYTASFGAVEGTKMSLEYGDAFEEGKEFDVASKRVDGIFSMRDKLDSGDSQREKAMAYAAMMRSVYLDPGRPERTYDDLIKFYFGKVGPSLAIDTLKRISEIDESVEIDEDSPISSLLDLSNNHPNLQASVDSCLRAVLKPSTRGLTPDQRSILELALSMNSKTEQSYWLRDIDVYSYISESASPMVGQVAALTHPQLALREAREVSRLAGYPRALEVRDLHALKKGIKKFSKTAKRMLDQRAGDNEELSRKMLDIHFLGSSAKPVLTKDRAIEEFREGASVSDVKAKFRSIGNKPLAAWKAHVTMGTYETQENQGEEIVEPSGIERKVREPLDKETLSKEEAIFLLREGVPTEEILAAYPESFTKGQLGAFKAWITMGKY